jgi:hypothetical protein
MLEHNKQTLAAAACVTGNKKVALNMGNNEPMSTRQPVRRFGCGHLDPAEGHVIRLFK